MYNKTKLECNERYRKLRTHRLAIDVKNQIFDDLKEAAAKNDETVTGYCRKAIMDRLATDNPNYQK